MRTLFPLLLLATLPCAVHAQVIRTVPVTVVNQPDVQATEDVDNPAFQPVQFSGLDSGDFSNPTVWGTGVTGDPVPDGKRLVIQHVSGRVSSEGLDGVQCRARVLTSSSETFRHALVPHRSTYFTSRIDTFSQPIAMYAEAGQRVSVACWVRTDDFTTIEAGYSGYFVDTN
ncbi:MAG: hypothetical protein QNK05_06590 [Myxococcota bacterium]|nr:hypothetical protein [Myxococcota bacterium]